MGPRWEIPARLPRHLAALTRGGPRDAPPIALGSIRRMTPPSDESDRDPQDLLDRARAGDQAAWDELFKTCYPKVIRVVRRKLNRPLRALYDSTDFASDVMKSLVGNLDRLDFPSIHSLMAFLTQAAEQKVIDE